MISSRLITLTTGRKVHTVVIAQFNSDQICRGLRTAIELRKTVTCVCRDQGVQIARHDGVSRDFCYTLVNFIAQGPANGIVVLQDYSADTVISVPFADFLKSFTHLIYWE